MKHEAEVPVGTEYFDVGLHLKRCKPRHQKEVADLVDSGRTHGMFHTIQTPHLSDSVNKAKASKKCGCHASLRGSPAVDFFQHTDGRR